MKVFFSMQYTKIKLRTKMLSSNQVLRLFYGQCLWKESVYVIEFCYENSCPEKSKGAIFGWMWSGIPSNAQTCKDVSELFLDHLRDTVKFKVVQNERLIEL